MSEPNVSRSPHEKWQKRITELATGDLNVLEAWRVRRHLARCPECANDFEQVTALFADLRALPVPEPVRPAPVWPISTTRAAAAAPTWNLGGFVMKRRTVLAATAFVFASLTGAVAARQFFFDPFQNFGDRAGHVWGATGDFRGQVKLFSVNNEPLGSYGSDDGEMPGTPTARVTVDGETYTVRGVGRHAISGTGGRLLGYAELVPETVEERTRGWEEHDKQLGIEERLHTSYGSDDGYGKAFGFIGEKVNRLEWKLSGIAEARFRKADNGHVVMRGMALNVSPEIRKQLRSELPPAMYQNAVANEVPKVPHFAWTQNGITQRYVGFGTVNLTLHDGTHLSVEIVPVKNH